MEFVKEGERERIRQDLEYMKLQSMYLNVRNNSQTILFFDDNHAIGLYDIFFSINAFYLFTS